MQNVSRIQKHPDTLIKNFFIGGLTQRKLQSDIFPKDSKKKQDMFNLEPEMLFSLYEEPEKMAAYLGQVFPDKVRILQTEKMVDPKFFTFMSVDAEGFNQYNHCLIFYERFTENLIREDFDERAYIERLVRKREKIDYKQAQKQELAGIAGQNGPQDKDSRPSEANDSQGASFGRAGELRIARKRMDRVMIKTDHITEVQPQDTDKKSVQQQIIRMQSEMASRQTESSIKHRQFTQIGVTQRKPLGTPTAAQQRRAQMGKSEDNMKWDDDDSSPLLPCDKVKKGLANGLNDMKKGMNYIRGKLGQGMSRMDTVEETNEEHNPNSLQQSRHVLGKVTVGIDEQDEDNYRDSLYGQTREDAMPEGKNESSIYHKHPSIHQKGGKVSITQMEQDTQESGKDQKMGFADLVKQTSMQAEKGSEFLNEQSKPVPEIIIDSTPKAYPGGASSTGSTQAHFSAQSSQQPQNQHTSTGLQSNRQSDASGFNPRAKGEYYFAPIAFVIQTEVEHHDIFKEVLLGLFESIRQPKEICQAMVNSKQKDRQLAFADFLCHLAFLASIPCPTFNTRYHIEFFGKTLTLSEPNYDEIPDKNQLAIRVLFDMLDVRTIIYCWKAILFDSTLVLISSQYSLQFYIAQALLQLVFPLTFQYSYVQPASAARIGMVQSPFPILFACSHLVQDFEYFEELGKDHIAICDIDGSYTNNLDFPILEDEKKILRSLSALKNFKGAKFDSAFHEMYQEDLINSDKQFTIEVRNVFFGILDQFLNQLPSGDYFKQLEQNEEKAFINYFDQEAYLDWFEGTQNIAFAERLMNSQLFATFCDDHFDRDVSNMLIYLNISSNGFNFDEQDDKDRSMKEAFEARLLKIFDEVKESGELIEHQQNLLKLSIRESTALSAASKDSLARVMNEIENKASKVKNKMSAKDMNHKSGKLSPGCDPINGCIRSENCDEIKDWPTFQKIDVCWRMPQDNQRVMIFEKLEYALQCYDRERSHCNKYNDSDEQLLDENHKEHMNCLFKTIKQVKQLYQESLPMYTRQIKWAGKDVDPYIATDSESLKSSSNMSATVAQGQKQMHRMKTQIMGAQPLNSTQESPLPVDLTSSDDTEMKLQKQMSKDTNQSKEQNNTSSEEMKFLHLSEIENESDCVEIGNNALTRSTRQNSNKEKQPVQYDTDYVPRQKSQHMKRGPAKNYVQATQEFTQNHLKQMGEEELTMQEVFWKQREQNVSYFSSNRIVEICYGLNGLIDFLDLLFTQFPSKRQAKAKFNYYFALKKQIQSIEQQITDQLYQSDDKPINNWFTSHQGLLEQLQPQGLYAKNLAVSEQKFPPMHQAVDQFPQLDLNPGVSIVFQGQDGEVCGLKQNLERSTSVRLWDMQDAKQDPLEQVKGGGLGVFQQSNIKSDVWMLPVLPENVSVEPGSNHHLSDIEKLVAFRTSYQYISMKQKLFFAFEDQEEAILLIFGEFLLFSQRDRQIFPTYRFYELLEVMTQPQKNRIFRKIVTHLQRPDEKMFQLRLMFEHEINGMDADNDEPVSLDDKLFDEDFLIEKPKKRILQHGATTDLPTKKPSITQKPTHLQHSKTSMQKSSRNTNSPCMQKKKAASAQVQHLQNLNKEMHSKMKRDKNKVATTGQGTTRQIQGISPRTSTVQADSQTNGHKSHQQRQLDLTNDLHDQQDADMMFMNRSQACDANPDGRNLALNGTVTGSEIGGPSTKNSMNFDKDCFMSLHKVADQAVVNPEKRVKKLLLKLVDLYTEVFDPKIFSEAQQKITKTDAIPPLKEKLKQLRELENERLSSVKIAFESIFDTEEAKNDQEIIKRCFWINLFNFKILMKVLEVLLTKPRTFQKLTNCTMFVCLMKSVKVKVQGHEIDCYEIFKTMLKHEDIHLLTGAFEDPVRCLEEMPEEIQELAVTQHHNLASFGLFMPIKKWSDFTIFEKETFELQLRKVIQDLTERIFISPDNFLIRIPKTFFRVLEQGNQALRMTEASRCKENKNDAIALLRSLVDDNILEPNFSPGSVYNNIVTVLAQIDNEGKSDMQPNMVGEQTSHVCEIDNFWWKFDLLSVRSNIREYCIQTGRNQSGKADGSRTGTVTEPLSTSASQLTTAEESKSAV